MSTRITINGKTHVVAGNAASVSIVNGAIMVNGNALEPDLAGIVEVKWEGPLAMVTSDASVTCGDVHGDVRAAGSVHANDVKGNVNAGGGVKCGTVGGDINAVGSVSCRR